MIDPTPDEAAALAVQLQYAAARDRLLNRAVVRSLVGDEAGSHDYARYSAMVARALADEVRCMPRQRGVL